MAEYDVTSFKAVVMKKYASRQKYQHFSSFKSIIIIKQQPNSMK